ncbi:MAG TPA: lytic transglycosylase domain-containing protein [Myxococcota bacterium]|nr:lytic transglycosylase domain-containing protein [Myxococcota bacterium]
MVATVRALAPARVGESLGGESPVAERHADAAAVIPLGTAGISLSALHPAFIDPSRGVQLRAPVQAVSGSRAMVAVNEQHPELTSSVVDRFLGVARHEITAASERTLHEDETRRLRVLLGANARLDPKTVPPTYDDQRLLQRLLNITLGAALNPPLSVDGNIGGATRGALQLYRRTRGLPATATNGALVDRALLERMGREAMQARTAPNPRVPAVGDEASPAERSVNGMLDLLSREDPVRYGALLRSAGMTSTRPLTAADLRRVIAAGAALNLNFDADTATRLQLAQPGFGEPLPWNYEATRVVASFLSGELSPNRGVAGLGNYRGWARRADHAGLVLPRVLEIDALVESSFNPRLVSSARARGLHQLTKDVTDRYGRLDPFNPVLNIGMARRELARVYDEQLRRLRAIDDSYARRYPDEASMPTRDTERNDGSIWRMAWAANNAGPRRLLRYQGVPPFDETQRHVMFLAWYNATLPGDGAVPPIGFAPPIPQGPQGPDDYGIKTVTKEF